MTTLRPFLSVFTIRSSPSPPSEPPARSSGARPKRWRTSGTTRLRGRRASGLHEAVLLKEVAHFPRILRGVPAPVVVEEHEEQRHLLQYDPDALNLFLQLVGGVQVVVAGGVVSRPPCLTVAA